MYRPYIKPVAEASPDVKVPKSRRSKFVLLVCRILGRIYLFFFLGVVRIVLRKGEHIAGAYKRALAGDSRCIIAFRHPNGGEPQLLMWFILFKLRAMARKFRIRFAKQPHVSFVYGYEVVRWGGVIARWVMPGLGSLPVHHAKVDSDGMARIFKAISEGPYPLAIAPEGQVSYTTEAVPRLEQGTVRIGFKAADRLYREGKTCPVEILPVSIHFRYGRMGQWSLNKLLRKIEKYTGFGGLRDKAPFSERLRRARDRILEHNEKRYRLSPQGSADGNQDSASGNRGSFDERIDAIMDAALDRAEKILGIKTKGNDLMERVYHIRQICWDRMIIPGITSFKGRSLMERAVADLNCGEAWYASRHMELVDFCWYFRIPIPEETAPLYIKLEYVQNLWDFANRSMGGAYSNRVFNVHPKRVLIQVAPVINLSARLKEYHENKKEAIKAVMEDLKNSFLDCIQEAAEYQIWGGLCPASQKPLPSDGINSSRAV
ncbi:MAG: acyltransferase [Treponema sp.]|jgi:1-acyl-sn-glycerol-3-phosphate acyltransferase|nr:acyltransferase [Treponema sp.]